MLATVNYLEDKATFNVVPTEGVLDQWTVRVEEVALLLPADADGAPSSPEDARAVSETAETETPEPTRSSKERVEYAVGSAPKNYQAVRVDKMLDRLEAKGVVIKTRTKPALRKLLVPRVQNRSDREAASILGCRFPLGKSWTAR